VFLSGWEDQTLAPTAFDLGGAAVRTLADLNPQVKNWTLGSQQLVHWRNSEGVEIEGLLMLPPRARPGVKLPLIVFPHGGPDDVTTRRFSGYTACFAARGYAVLRPNYRGSLAYGHDFYAANRGRFGDIETHDIEGGVDALIASGRVDPNQLYFGGWSWGGYISAWTLTHQTRYRAIVVGAGVNDVSFSYSTSDINHGRAAQWEYQGDPWHQTANFDRANPIRFATNAKTPTLILHGEEDTRVPFADSRILYRALRDVGCPVKFYAYPREDHNFVEPAHAVHVLSVWVDWFDAHAGRSRALR
jgi:dipeptidyl aminopeptidase/acylaminoacyl peptidase